MSTVSYDCIMSRLDAIEAALDQAGIHFSSFVSPTDSRFFRIVVAQEHGATLRQLVKPEVNMVQAKPTRLTAYRYTGEAF